MPTLTNIEDTFLTDLHAQAESLTNGNNGNMQVLCDVMGKTAKVVVAMARTGGVSPSECKAVQQSLIDETRRLSEQSDWKAKLAMWIPITLGVLALAAAALKLA